MYEEEVDVEVGDETPGIREQAAKRGWACDFFDFPGKAAQPNVEYFNPGLVRRPDGLWLLVRRSEITPGMWYGRNSIWACKLENGLKPLGGPVLQFLESKNEEQFEDPRGVFWNGQTWIGCVNFTWFDTGHWTGAHQMIGVFKDNGGTDITEETWTPIARRDPPVGTNSDKAGDTQGKHNKNLLWWFREDRLHCLYKSDPWMVVEFGSKWTEQTEHIGEGVKWKYGLVRGGTPPVLVGDKYFTFFHSSMPWRGRYRRYYMGALAFESKPPFQPILWTQEPLLTGSQNDPWTQRKPLVVFPCGALMEDGKWTVTLGVNDLRSAWIQIPHEELLKSLNPIPVLPGLSLLADRTETPEYPPVLFVEQNVEDLSGGVQAGTRPGQNSPLDTDCLRDNRHVENVSIPKEGATRNSGSSAPPAQTPLEKARAALAEKRRLGTLVSKPRCKRRRRSRKALKSSP